MIKTRQEFVCRKGPLHALIVVFCFAGCMLSSAYAASPEPSRMDSSHTGEEGFIINAGLNDAWFNPATNGQGLLITVFPAAKVMFVAWFTYDTERPPEDVMAQLGEPGHRWLTAQGPYDGDTANLTISMTQGGVFNAAEPPTTRDPNGYGTMTLQFADCTEGLVNYEITSLGISGEIPIQRVVPENVPMCEELVSELQAAEAPPEPEALKGITAAHNVVRASVGVPPLVWDPALAEIAQNWADACVNNEEPDTLIDHNPDRGDNYPQSVGENIYGSSIPATPQRAVDSWASEAEDYDYGSNSCSGMCGHYTQMVWKTSERLGCGISECGGVEFGNSIVCNYSPAGNTGGRPY